MTDDFLRSAFDRMFWLDSDIVFTPDDVLTLLNLDVDIGVAAYPMKDGPFLSVFRNLKTVSDASEFDGPTEVDCAGCGFMVIKRHVIETLSRTLDRYHPFGGVEGRSIAALYQSTAMCPGEDIWFSVNARSAGFKIIWESSIRLGHVGQSVFLPSEPRQAATELAA
jgi:hypothetical protein